MEISIQTPSSGIGVECINDTDKIIMALMGDNDPLGAIMRLYEQAGNKQNFTLALVTVLLMRHRQWQAVSGNNLR